MRESPFERSDLSVAIAGAAISNRLSDKAIKPTDLIPRFGPRETPQQSPDDLRAYMIKKANRDAAKAARKPAATDDGSRARQDLGRTRPQQ